MVCWIWARPALTLPAWHCSIPALRSCVAGPYIWAAFEPAVPIVRCCMARSNSMATPNQERPLVPTFCFFMCMVWPECILDDITCTGPQIWDTDLLLCGHERWADLIGADLGRRPVAVPLADPALVVGLPKGAEGRPRLLDGREVADPQQVLLQGPDEALGTAVAFGLAHERRRALDTQEADLGLEVVADVLAPVIAAKLEADGDVVGKRAKALAHRLLDRLERPKTLCPATGPPPAPAGRPRG